MQQRNEELTTRRIAKVLRDVLAAETFTTYADLTDALKYRLAQLRIPWTPRDIFDAQRLVESNRPLLVSSNSARVGPDPALSHPSVPNGGVSGHLLHLIRGLVKPWPARKGTAAPMPTGMTFEQVEEFCRHAVKAEEINWEFK
jgi:hypothetical protein